MKIKISPWIDNGHAMQKTKCYQNVSIFSLFPTTLSRKQQRWWYQSEKFISVYTYWHIHKIFAVCFLKNLNQIKKSKDSFRFKLTVHRSQIGSYNCLRCSMKVVYYIFTSTPEVVRIHFWTNPRTQLFLGGTPQNETRIKVLKVAKGAS